MELDAGGETVVCNVIFEDGTDLGEIEADAGDVWVGESDLGDEIALRGTDVNGGLVVGPGELFCNSDIGTVADTGHGAKKSAQTCGIGVEGNEGIFTAATGLVLRFAGTERGGEV